MMNTKKLYVIIAAVLKEEHGIESYRIEGMKMSKRNYFINENGMLDSIGYLDVRIKPKEKTREITISVKNE